MKLITQLVDYLRSRGALSPAQLKRLEGKGFIDLSADSEDRPSARQEPVEEEDLDWEALAPAPRPTGKRRGRKGKHVEPDTTVEELAGRLAERFVQWEGSLRGLVAVAPSCRGWREAADCICKHSAEALVAALGSALRGNSLSASELWDALHFEGYREELPALAGAPRKAYRALLTGRHVSELTGYAWLLKYEEPAAVYRLIRAQKALAAALRSVYQVMPERVRRGLHNTAHGRAVALLEAARWLPAERRRLNGESARYYLLLPQVEDWWQACSVALQIDPERVAALLSHCGSDPFVAAPVGQVPPEVWRFTVGEEEWRGRGGDELVQKAIDGVVSAVALRAALQHPYPLVRWHALHEAERLNAGLVATALDDPEWDIAFRAARWLHPNPGVAIDERLRVLLAAALPPLITGAGQDSAVRRVLLGMVEKLGPLAAASLPALAEWVSDPALEVRTHLAQALGSVAGAAEEVVPLLLGLLGDANELVAMTSARSLGKLGAESEAAVPALVRAVTTADSWTRSYAVSALGMIGRRADEVVPPLMRAVEDPVARVRQAALEALHRLGGGGESVLMGCLKDEDAGVRLAAVVALAPSAATSPAALAALSHTLMHDTDTKVGEQAAWALEAVPALLLVLFLPQLLRTLDDPGSGADVRLRLSSVVKRLRDNPEKAIRSCLQSLRSPGKAAAAAAALRQAAVSACTVLPELVKMALAQPDAGPGKQAMVVLERTGKPAVALVASLVRARTSRDAGVRQDAAEALSCLGRTASLLLPEVFRAIRSRKPPVRLAGRRLLARLAPFASAWMEELESRT